MVEHHAVLHALDCLENEGVNIQYVDLDENGSPKLDHLERLLEADDSIKLVSLMHINNEIGNVLNLNKVGNLCRENGAYFHTDAVQGIGHYSFDLNHNPLIFWPLQLINSTALRVSVLLLSEKILVWILLLWVVLKNEVSGQELSRCIILLGCKKPLRSPYEKLEEEKNYILDLKKYFVKKVKSLYPSVHFNGLSGSFENSSYTLVSIAIPLEPSKSQLLDFHMDLKGIACSKGSACQAGAHSDSHVLGKLQRSEAIKNRPSLRFSFSSFNTKEEVDYVIDSLAEFQN